MPQWNIVSSPQSPGGYIFPSKSSLPATPTSESNSLMSPKQNAPLRHNEYYFDDGNIVFQVEETLFKVHRYFLVRDSPKLRDMLSILHPSGFLTCMSEEKPIVLPQVAAADFARLLWMFYNPKISEYKASVEDWCAILALADRWQMDTIKAIAIEEVGKLPMDPVEKIMLGERYGVDKQWALEAYVSLCTRDRRLSLEEGRKVGVDLLTLIASAREEVILMSPRINQRTFPALEMPPTTIKDCSVQPVNNYPSQMERYCGLQCGDPGPVPELEDTGPSGLIMSPCPRSPNLRSNYPTPSPKISVLDAPHRTRSPSLRSPLEIVMDTIIRPLSIS